MTVKELKILIEKFPDEMIVFICSYESENNIKSKLKGFHISTYDKDNTSVYETYNGEDCLVLTDE